MEYYYFYTMKEDKLVSIKVWESTRKALKIITAKKEEKQPETVDRLVSAELVKIETKSGVRLDGRGFPLEQKLKH